jgi:hypothetical protein
MILHLSSVQNKIAKELSKLFKIHQEFVKNVKNNSVLNAILIYMKEIVMINKLIFYKTICILDNAKIVKW